MSLEKMDKMIEMANQTYQSAMKNKDHVGASEALRVLMVLEKERSRLENVQEFSLDLYG